MVDHDGSMHEYQRVRRPSECEACGRGTHVDLLQPKLYSAGG